MRVAHLITNMKLGGPNKVMMENIAHLPAEVTSDIFYCKDLEGFDNGIGARKLTAATFRSLNNFDVVHSHGLRPDAAAALSALLHRRTVHVSTIHNYYREELRNIYGARAAKWVPPFWKRAWLQMDEIVVLTEDAKSYYRTDIPERRINVIGNGMDLAFSDKALGGEEKKILEELRENYNILGCNAHIIKRKGIDQIIRTLPELPDYALVIVGEGPYRKKLEELSSSLNVNDRCKFFGFKRNAINFLPFYDVYVMASRDEGFGMALIEGMAFGVPIVCSNIPSFREILSECEGTFFDLDDQQSLIRAIRQAYADRIQLGEKGRLLYSKRYTGQIMADRYHELYRRLVGQKKTGHGWV